MLQRFPEHRFVGLDISEANIREVARVHPDSQWVAADYMRFSDGRFDLIISERSLHIFQCTDDQLAEKLALDLAPRGVAVITLPASCLCTMVHRTSFAVSGRNFWIHCLSR
jgi:trans-aconitate methyltransferase